MPRFLAIAAAALAIAFGNAHAAHALDAGKVATISQASASFEAMAKGSHETGKPPRLADPAVKPLLDLVFDTSELDKLGRQPMSKLGEINNWALAVIKVGFVYILSGTGVSDFSKLTNDPKTTQKIEENTVEFQDEIGRFYDAQLRLQTAMIDTVHQFLTTGSRSEIDKPNVKSGVAQIRAGCAQTISGVLTTFPTAGLTEQWKRERIPALQGIAPIAARFLLPEDVRALRETALDVAGKMTDPTVKAGLTAFADTIAPR
jgi:hypothetical protein